MTSFAVVNHLVARVPPYEIGLFTRLTGYIHGFYNPTRLHSTLGYLSPNDYARKLKKAA